MIWILFFREINIIHTLNLLSGSNLDAFIAGKIETIIVTKIELNAIIKIEVGLISEGIVLKK